VTFLIDIIHPHTAPACSHFSCK